LVTLFDVTYGQKISIKNKNRASLRLAESCFRQGKRLYSENKRSKKIFQERLK